MVTSLNDAGTGTGARGDLRYCINRTNARAGADSIVFLSTLVGTINLVQALPSLTGQLTILGNGPANTTIDGSGGSVLSVSAGANIYVSNVTITGGNGNGGGIFSFGTLTVNNAVITGNVAGCPNCGGGTGGGIWNYSSGTLIVSNSTISGNSALGTSYYGPGSGGGIANNGTATVTNSTISSNVASYGLGGGIVNTGTLTLEGSTITKNTGHAGAAGVVNQGIMASRNTIIAANGNWDISGNIGSQGHNLIGNTINGSGFAPTDLLNVNAMLGPLQNNGGPTSTHALLSGSPAINAGDNANAPPWDQRGSGFLRIVGGTIDIGSIEIQ